MRDHEGLERIDTLLAEFQRACEIVVVRGDSHLSETTKHRAILRNELRAALLSGRQRLAAIRELCKETDDLYCDSDDLARFYASTIEKIEAIAATQEPR